MGAELAAEADAIYKAWVEATPAYARMQEEGVADTETFAELMAAHVGGLRRAMLFLAEQMEDPHPLNEALLESLQAFMDGPDAATEPAG
jgi:hypothetical protein